MQRLKPLKPFALFLVRFFLIFLPLCESSFIFFLVYFIYLFSVLFIYYKSTLISSIPNNTINTTNNNNNLYEEEHMELLAKHHSIIESTDLEYELDPIPTIITTTTQKNETFIHSSFDHMHDIMSYPIRYVLGMIFPKMSDELDHPHHLLPSISLGKAFLSLGMCIFGISVLASFIISLSTQIITMLGIDSATMGATLVAFGSEVCHPI